MGEELGEDEFGGMGTRNYGDVGNVEELKGFGGCDEKGVYEGRRI